MTEPASDPPDISVIVIIIDGTDALGNCLDALSRQTGDMTLEVIVPHDQISGDAATLAATFPKVRFLDLGTVKGAPLSEDPMGFYNACTIRRAAGIKAARGRLIGMLTDRGIPAPDWAENALQLQRQHSAAAVGGCTDNGIDTIWHWAVHFYDFARYMPPQPTTMTAHLSVTNVCYEASALAGLGDLAKHRFRELAVHEALAASGQKMILSDGILTTEYRPKIPTRDLAMEWFTWGRKYSGFRVSEIPTRLRLARILATPIVPFVLWFRQLGIQREKKVHMDRFWRASPLLFLIVTMWALGELTGYCLGPKKEVA